MSSSSTPWTEAHQGSLPFTICRSLLKLMSIESLMPSKHLILCHPLLLLPTIFSSIRDFSNESILPIRWPKYWSFNFSFSSSNEHPGLISFRMDGWISLQSKGLSRVFSNTTVQKHQFFIAAAAKLLQSCPTLCDPIEGSPAGSPIPGILQARTLEWVAISLLYKK